MRDLKSFIEERKSDWLKLSALTEQFDKYSLRSSNKETIENFLPLYRKISSDYSLARSLFPGHELVRHLAAMVYRCRVILEAGWKRESDSLNFFGRMAESIYRARWSIVVSATVFLFGIFLGWLIQGMNHEIVYSLAGEKYMDITVQNMRQGEPMAIYRSTESNLMVNLLLWNNIRVAILAFTLGIIFGAGTFFVLLYNGLLIGTLAMFFQQNGFALEFWSTIMLHGTLELSAIVLAGSAGLELGKGLFIPGQKTRLRSLQNGAIHSFKLVVSTIPLFLIAALIETWYTPKTGLTLHDKTAVIGVSLFFLILYYAFFFSLASRTQKTPNDREAFLGIQN